MSVILALPKLFDDVSARFVAETVPPAVPVPNVFGWRARAQRPGVTMRIVWIPGDDESGELGDLTSARGPGQNPRPLATLGELFTVYVEAQDPSAPEDERAQYQACRVLFDAWWRAVYLDGRRTVTLVKDAWVIDKKERRFGAAIRALCSIEAMIPDTPAELAPVDTKALIDDAELNVTERITTSDFDPATAFGADQIVYYDAEAPGTIFEAGGDQAEDNDPIRIIANLGSDGSALDLIQATAGKRPIWLPNATPLGKHAFSFDGIDDAIRSALRSAGVPQPWSLALVCKPAATASSFYVCSGEDSEANRSDISMRATGFAGFAGQFFPVTYADSPDGTVLNTWRSVLFEGNGPNSRCYMDNVAGPVADAGSHQYRGTGLGSLRDSVSTFWPGLIAEYRVIRRLLTDSEKADLYLLQRARWGH